jgi:hypothetical protein
MTPSHDATCSETPPGGAGAFWGAGGGGLGGDGGFGVVWAIHTTQTPMIRRIKKAARTSVGADGPP